METHPNSLSIYKMKKPAPFWETRVHDLQRGLSGLCVGYEQKVWRYDDLVDYAMEWLPEFCLTSKERGDIAAHNAVQRVKKAAHLIYTTPKYKNRGEFGEIFLHAAIREVFDSIPAISKFFYKSSHNETVKGFDCVHIVGNTAKGLQLWLGESKFYNNISAAIRDVTKELKLHFQKGFLRNEFVLIGNKIDIDEPHKTVVENLLSNRTSLDAVFQKICSPIMLTYDSDTVSQHDSICESYKNSFEMEIEKNYAAFQKACTALPKISFHLFLLPLANKIKLVKKLDSKLKAYQNL